MDKISYRVAMVGALFAIGLAPAVSAQMKHVAHKTAAKRSAAVTSAAPPAPAEAAAKAPSPTPIGDPGTWVTAADYPASSSAAGHQGRTVFALDVDTKGRVTGCRVLQSSGFPLLDNTTCTAMVTNARFKPATAADGRAVAGAWESAMDWKLAEMSDEE
jgi:protein TonB